VLAICPACFIPPVDGCEVVHAYKLDDPVLLAAEGFSRATAGRGLIQVDNTDGANPHDPHGANFVAVLRPLVATWMRTGSLFERAA
jgi:hypothetical protein